MLFGVLNKSYLNLFSEVYILYMRALSIHIKSSSSKTLNQYLIHAIQSIHQQILSTPPPKYKYAPTSLHSPLLMVVEGQSSHPYLPLGLLQ